MRTRTSATTRAVVATATSIVLSFGLGGVALSSTADAATGYVAVSAVYVRSGPSTSYKILGTLATGQKVSGSSTSSGWVKISFKGGTGYVYGSYLKQSASASTATTRVTTADVNLRSAASRTSTVLKVLLKGTAVTTTGKTSGDFSQVTVDGTNGWVSTAYLVDATTAALPAVKLQATTTAVLAMRQTPSINATSRGDLKVGTVVGMTGTHSGSYSQIVYKEAVAWVLSGYLTATGTSTTLPKASGKRYVKVDEVNIRATSAADGAVVDTVTMGTVLVITGVTKKDRSQIIYNGTLRWAYTAYLSKTKPSADAGAGSSDGGSLGSDSLDRTNAYAKTIVRTIRAEFPQIKTMYGWRVSSAYSSDHPSGRAIDIMIPSYKTSTGKKLGDTIALYLQKNHKKLHIHYLIWRQRSWNVERDTATTAWKKMENRGSDTQNHMDHVHVSVYDVS